MIVSTKHAPTVRHHSFTLSASAAGDCVSKLLTACSRQQCVWCARACVRVVLQPSHPTLPLALAPVFPLLSVVADLPATLLASAIPLAVPYPATGTKALD